MQRYKELLLSTLNAHRDAYIRPLAELAQIDTHDIGHGIEGGLEAKGQEYLRELFKKMDPRSISAENLTEGVIQKAIARYQEGNPGHDYTNRYNLYAQFKGGGPKSIMFNGHMDTMSPGDESAWTVPPYGAVIRNGKMYGLGVCDMKAGLMASIMAVQLLKDAGIPLPCTVTISSVCDEEGGGNGSIVAAMGGQKADAVVVCEPTQGELLIAHMGFIFFHVEVEGIAVHSGRKTDGVNAIDKAVRIIHALNDLEHDWLLRYKHPLLPPPSGNVGVIGGGKAGSTVPDYCSFKTCVHYHPGTMSRDQVIADYRRAIDLCCDGDAFLRDHRPRVSIYQSGGPFEMEAGHPLVSSFKAAWNTVFDTPLCITGSASGCDSRIWRGIADCPTIQYGPGALQQCHAVDEYVDIEEYLQAIRVYAHLILEWGQG
ncbi:acetylornithine deacetylase [Spirochaetia bacterium]|nr:acetylornithine deacetylase [Spirochaetia bacterium]